MALGLRRVQRIRAYLLRHGIEPVRIGVAFRGEGWSLLERTGKAVRVEGFSRQCWLQVADPHWMLSRN